MSPFSIMNDLLKDSPLMENGFYGEDQIAIRCNLQFSQVPFYSGYEFNISESNKEILVFKPDNFVYDIGKKINIGNIEYTIDGVISDDGSVIVFSVV